MIYLMIVVGAIESTVEGCKSACMLYDVDELRLLRLLRDAARDCDRMGLRMRPASSPHATTTTLLNSSIPSTCRSH